MTIKNISKTEKKITITLHAFKQKGRGKLYKDLWYVCEKPNGENVVVCDPFQICMEKINTKLFSQ